MNTGAPEPCDSAGWLERTPVNDECHGAGEGEL